MFINSAIVIGSSGFIGTHLCNALAEKGINEIHKIDINSSISTDIRKPFDNWFKDCEGRELE